MTVLGYVLMAFGAGALLGGAVGYFNGVKDRRKEMR